MTDKIRQELIALRARMKPPTTMQEHLEQRQIEQRIRHLQNVLDRQADSESK